MRVNRERQKVWHEKCKLDYLDFENCDLDELMETLQKYRDRYGPGCRIQKCYYDYSNDTYLAIMKKEDETDKEMQIRIDNEEKREEYFLERERQEYERLKSKFGQ